MQAIINVLALPPKESFNILVSLESLYGTWLLIPFFWVLAKTFIQFPSANKLLLILDPSKVLIPLPSWTEAF